MSYNDKSGEGVINGTAYDISSLTKWLDELEDVSGIDDAQFSISSTSGSNQLIRFELNFTVLPAFLNNSQEVVD